MAADEIVDGGENEAGLDRPATCHADLDKGEAHGQAEHGLDIHVRDAGEGLSFTAP